MKKAKVLLAALLLSACSSGGTGVPDLNFGNMPQVQLDVGKIEVVDAYHPPLQPPNVEHLFRQPPGIVVHNLIDHTLVAAGGEKTMRVTISDASVIDRKLPMSDGILGNTKFNSDPSDRYEAKVALKFEVFDPAAPDIVTGHADVIAKRNATLLNNYTLADRDRTAYDLTDNLMRDVEEGLQTTVKNTFGRK